MGPYAGVDYNLALCPLQSRLQHIYIWQPSARDLNPMPESTLSPSQGLLIWPLSIYQCLADPLYRFSGDTFLHATAVRNV